jgi:DNA-directed RNA polymerase specialized sigma24 family protein
MAARLGVGQPHGLSPPDGDERVPQPLPPREARGAQGGRRRAAVDAFGAVDDGVSVSNALARLTPKQRAAVVLTDLLGYSAEEAAGSLGSVARRSARVVEAAPVLDPIEFTP